MLGVLSIWLWRSSISVRPPSGSTPSSGAPVVLSRKSSRRPLPVQGSPTEGWGEMRGSVGVGGERWRGDGGEDGEGGSEWSGAREGSGLALKPGISEGRWREKNIIINTGDDTRDVFLSLMFATEFITSTLEQDVKQVVHLLAVHAILLLTEKNIQ